MPTKIAPCFWFDNQAEEAARYYCGIFPDSKITAISRYPESHNEKPAGSVLLVAFDLRGQSFTALNGGPHFQFNEAISFQIECEDQKEVDYYWEALSKDGGQTQQCGWLTDKFGVTWQVVPKQLEMLMNDPDAAAAERVTKAMLAMTKLDVEGLEKAYRGDV